MPRPPSRSTGQNNFPLNAKRKWAIPLITATFFLLVAAAVLFVRLRHQRTDLVALSNEATAPTLKEINARYVEPPAGQNAADFYLQGFDSMRVEDVSLLKVPLLGSGKLPPLGSTRSGLALVLGVAGVDISPGEHEAITARIQKGDHFKDEQQFLKKAGHQFMAARKEAFPERLKAEQLIHALVKEAGEKQFLISKHLLGGLAAPVLKEAGSLAQARLGLTALALEQFRATHENKYPSALSALTPDYLATIPADPFDGQPLRYRIKANGYLLYSIGPDLKDDSGDPIIGKNGDIVFMVVQTPKPL